MSARPVHIPFDRDGSGRFLPWLIALMVYLAALAAAGAFALGHALATWERGLEGTLTVELPAAPEAGPNELPAALAALLEPWLGRDLPRDLPLPRLIDVRLDGGQRADLAAIRAALAKAAPDASLDDGRLWLEPAEAFVDRAAALALGIVLLTAGAAVLSVVFATRTGLAVHRDVIELLHLVGARDAYIVDAFARRALALGLMGGALGLALAYATVLPWGGLAAGTEAALLPWHLVALAVLPPAAALLAVATARRTVARALARMP